jgi:hypothetical protein
MCGKNKSMWAKIKWIEKIWNYYKKNMPVKQLSCVKHMNIPNTLIFTLSDKHETW